MPSQMPATRWGLWATIGFSIIIVAVYFLSAILVAAVMTFIEMSHNPNLNPVEYGAVLAASGFYLSLIWVVSALMCTGFIILFSELRAGITVKQYLGLTSARPMDFIGWTGITLILIGALTVLSFTIEVQENFMVEIYSSAENKILFMVGIVLAAPIFEELLFRGFLFEGIRDSKLGAVGAVLATSLLWASIHTQYEILGISYIIIFGIILGIAKIKTRSIYLVIFMHALNNFISVAEVAYFLN
ncbi:MAG: CPBP family intramembrane glutamic endopeptidase [Nitrospinales bacterium]